MRRKSNTSRLINKSSNFPVTGNGSKGSGLGDLTNIVNKFFTGQEFPGERHAVSLSGPYKGQLHRYSGPQTNLDARLRRGDKPINDLDEAAYYHDLAYRDNLNAYRNSPDYNSSDKAKKAAAKKAFLNNVWDADDKFVRKAFNSKDDPVTGKVAGTLIKGKEIAEKAGLLDTSVFSGAGNVTKSTDPLKNLRSSYLSNLPKESRGKRKGRSRSRSRDSRDYSEDSAEDNAVGYPIGYQEGGILPIGPIISVLATVAPPIIEYVWNKVHGSKGSGGYYGKGASQMDVEDKRAILMQEMAGR